MSLENLNKVQKTAVESIDKPVLIFAGAGSGKTRVITQKIAYLIQQEFYKPEEILAVTFTNKAANEMKERVRKLLKQDLVSINIGTFHSICARLLRQEISRLGYTSDYVIYDSIDQLALIKLVLDGMNISKDYLLPRKVQNYISGYKNKLLFHEDVAAKAGNILVRTVAEVYANYQKELKKNNAVDFDDLLILPLVLFENYPAVLRKYQERWKYIVVDEYQDTNRPQFLFVSRLAEKHNHICVVGDDDQSIYGWRGADIRNILDFEKVFKDCVVFKLEKNYRSTQKILSAASAVVQNNEHRAHKELVSVCGAGEKLGLIETQDEMEEADAVVNAIEKEIKLNKRKFNDFAVLYRTNAQSRALEDSLMQMGIPYDIVGGIRFYERKEIKDFLAYLKLIVNLEDTVALRRVINFPPRGIGSKTIDKCIKRAEKVNKRLFDVLAEPSAIDIRGKQADSLSSFFQIVSKYHDLLDKLNVSELAQTLIEDTGFIKHYKEQNTAENQDRVENIEELLKAINVFSRRNSENNLQRFIEDVTLLTDIDNWNEKVNRITLMTAHSSKGLEFPVVFITGMEEGLFPHYNSLKEDENVEEERRLFYVAITRAQKQVYLLYANARRRMGSDQVVGLVSRFIHEIPENYLMKIRFTSALTRKVVRTGWGNTKTVVKRTVTVFDDFKKGDYVEHAIFGIGKIEALSGSGENQRVGIVFKDGQKRKLVVKFAKLKKIQNPNSLNQS